MKVKTVEIIDRGCQFYSKDCTDERNTITDAVDVLLAYGITNMNIVADEQKAVFVLDREAQQPDNGAFVRFIHEARTGKKAR